MANCACPKDDFPLLVTKLMIDSTIGHEALSFMDCTTGYNEIQMVLEDQETTAYCTPNGIFCYKVMPFGLKNTGATCQRAIQTIFEDMQHKTVECYINDLVVKLRKRPDQLRDLQQIFERLRRCQLKMNPPKCAFGVTSGNFLGLSSNIEALELTKLKSKPFKTCLGLRTLKSFAVYRGAYRTLEGSCQTCRSLWPFQPSHEESGTF